MTIKENPRFAVYFKNKDFDCGFKLLILTLITNSSAILCPHFISYRVCVIVSLEVIELGCCSVFQLKISAFQTRTTNI